MAVKKCCIEKCGSSSTRYEDKGVTYHKFPKDAKLCEKWEAVTHHPTPKLTPPSFVCSRHFCKADFVKNKEANYILKSDAIPSIFSWSIDNINMEISTTSEKELEDENAANVSGSSKGSEAENLYNIQKFIEAQERELQELAKNDKIGKSVDVKENTNTPDNIEANENVANTEKEICDENVLGIEQNENVEDNEQEAVNDDTMAVASSVMEMILNETEAKSMQSVDDKELPKPLLNSGSNSMSLSVGCKVEAKDFSEEWYPADIVEVDFDEMEVLVHYDNFLKKPDEWINVSSPRLRPFTGSATDAPKPAEPPETVKEIKEEVKEDKSKVYVVGERCLARWRDNRRFVATIDKDLGDGKFEVLFDDGFCWQTTITRLSKLKEVRDSLTIDTSVQPSSGAPSPVLPGGPNTLSPLPPLPAYHTHLFDPARDYLGSKSERRERKRKINIKEIFNIGQKKQKIPKIEKEKVPRVPVKRIVKPKVKKEVKSEKAMSDAVAAIIGTVKEEMKREIKEEVKLEPYDMDDNFNIDDSSNSKSDDLDPVDQEDKLERFDKPDEKLHEGVIDKIKEAIIKLEGGLSDIKVESPRVIRVESPKPNDDIPKPVVDVPKPIVNTPEVAIDESGAVIDTSKAAIDTPELVIDGPEPINTPKPVIDTQKPVDTLTSIEILKTVIDTPKPVTASPKPTKPATIPIVVIEKTIPYMKLSRAESEDREMDVPSPSVIEASAADIENLLQDSDATKSDFEFDASGIESPRLDLDIETQPILVDIEAPLDNDPPEISQAVEIGTNESKSATERRPKKKVKKAKKSRALMEQTEVERVKNELAAVKRKYEEMKRMMRKDKEKQAPEPLPESSLAPHEWACRWRNGQPVGRVSEVEADGKPDAAGKPPLPRRSVQVVDRRLPRGWSKHMVRRSVGHSAGKWDVVLISPNNRRFHTKTDMRNFLASADASVKPYEYALLDFGNHLKLSRKLGWISSTPDGLAAAPETILPASSVSSLSPLVKKKSLSLKRRGGKLKDNKRPIKIKLQRRLHTYNSQLIDADASEPPITMPENRVEPPPAMPIEDGYVWVGSLKVQVIQDLLRCPADGCFKNFRNNTLLQMHIKHYHRELRKMMGATPKVLDLAAARTIVPGAEIIKNDPKLIKVKINKPPKPEPKPDYEDMDVDVMLTPTKEDKIPRSQDSPKLRNALINKPAKRPRVLLPMKRMEPEQTDSQDDEDTENSEEKPVDVLDFETAISTHTVTKPLERKRKGDKKKSFASFAKNISEDEEWFAMNSDDVDTRSSFPRSGSPDSKIMEPKTGLLMSSDTIDDQNDDPTLYTFTETGERIKIVHMRREEIINCHCGFREEDGLMVQCELCLCWQHALCHNIQRESEVPEKYTCSICLNPRRGRRSKRFLHDQDRMYEGLLPGAKIDESVRRSHELAGNLLRIEDALHALRVKYYVATKKDHPKLYLWAKDWEQTEMTYKLTSDYSDLNIMLNGMDKENLPIKEDPALMDIKMPSEEDADSDRYSRGDSGQLGSAALLSGLLSSPGAASLELPISTSELERLAKTVQEAAAAAEWAGQGGQAAPQPEAPIENEVCRERLLRHVQRCQALLDSRLDSIEAQVAELESQDPSFGENYETAEHYPRIKQTVQMMLRDLDTMEELGVIT